MLRKDFLTLIEALDQIFSKVFHLWFSMILYCLMEKICLLEYKMFIFFPCRNLVKVYHCGRRINHTQSLISSCCSLVDRISIWKQRSDSGWIQGCDTVICKLLWEDMTVFNSDGGGNKGKVEKPNRRVRI